MLYDTASAPAAALTNLARLARRRDHTRTWLASALYGRLEELAEGRWRWRSRRGIRSGRCWLKPWAARAPSRWRSGLPNPWPTTTASLPPCRCASSRSSPTERCCATWRAQVPSPSLKNDHESPLSLTTSAAPRRTSDSGRKPGSPWNTRSGITDTSVISRPSPWLSTILPLCQAISDAGRRL